MELAFVTERLFLRPLTLADDELLFRLDGDPEVMRFLSGGPGTPLEAIRGEILPRFIGYAERAPWAGVWVAHDRSGGGFVGWFSLRPGDDLTRGGDLGYRLMRDSWGQGLATEGAGALIDRAFAEWGMPRVFGSTYEFNVGSRRVMEKLGMTHVRSFRLSTESAADRTFADSAADEWDGDEVEYALARADWERLRASPVPGNGARW